VLGTSGGKRPGSGAAKRPGKFKNGFSNGVGGMLDRAEPELVVGVPTGAFPFGVSVPSYGNVESKNNPGGGLILDDFDGMGSESACQLGISTTI